MLKKVLKRFSVDKGTLLFFLITITLILMRFLWLREFPAGLSHDEADVVLSAKNYAINGEDISGVKFPLSLFSTKTQAGLAGLPSAILGLVFAVVDLNIVSSRIIFVLINILTGAILAALTWKLSKLKTLSQISFLVFLANPWSFIYSRSITEAPFALLFILAGTFLLFCFRGQKIYFSLLFFVLAFFSYFGAKPLVPLVLFCLLLAHAKFIKGTSIKNYVIYYLIFLSIFTAYFIISFKIPGGTTGNRYGEFIFSNINRYESLVNDQRRTSITFQGSVIFNNKLTNLFEDMVKKYLGVYSPDFLFYGGDPRATYRLGSFGMFHILDFAFILLGIFGLAKIGQKQNLLAIVVAIFCLVGPLVSTMTLVENSYIFRSFLVLPGIIVLIAVGIYFLINKFKHSTKTLVTLSLVIIYSFLCIKFFYFYFLKLPVTQQENNFFSENIVANYLTREKDNTIVVSNSPIQLFQQYLFFSGYLNKNKLVPEAIDREYKVGNILFTSKCESINTQNTIIVSSKFKCAKLNDLGYLKIEDQKDSGLLYRIYNDKICERSNLVPWKRFNFITDYNLYGMNNNTFCERWIQNGK